MDKEKNKKEMIPGRCSTLVNDSTFKLKKQGGKGASFGEEVIPVQICIIWIHSGIFFYLARKMKQLQYLP